MEQPQRRARQSGPVRHDGLLARLIAPEQFGVFAVAFVAYQIIMSCNELGVSVAIVRWPGDPARIIPTVWTLNLISSGLLATAVWVAAPWFAAAQNAPEATGVLRLLALAIPIAGFTAVPFAMVQRTFRQDLRMLADLTNMVVSTSIAVTLALMGSGAYALAWSQLLGNAVAGLVLWRTAPRPRAATDRASTAPWSESCSPSASRSQAPACWSSPFSTSTTSSWVGSKAQSPWPCMCSPSTCPSGL